MQWVFFSSPSQGVQLHDRGEVAGRAGGAHGVGGCAPRCWLQSTETQHPFNFPRVSQGQVPRRRQPGVSEDQSHLHHGLAEWQCALRGSLQRRPHLLQLPVLQASWARGVGLRSALLTRGGAFSWQGGESCKLGQGLGRMISLLGGLVAPPWEQKCQCGHRGKAKGRGGSSQR